MIQTLKHKIFRYICKKNSPCYIDHLQDFVTSYNKAFHSGIQCEPINVTDDNEHHLWWQMYWPKKDYKEAQKAKHKKI